MAVLKTLIVKIVTKGEYPVNITDSIVIDTNTRGMNITFKPESVRKVASTFKLMSAEPDIVWMVDTIKRQLTPNEKNTIKLIKTNGVGKSNG